MALEYNPESRFRTAADMKQALMDVARKTGALVRAFASPQPGAGSTGGIKPLWSFKCEDEIRGTPAISQGCCILVPTITICMP